jgi:ElaB/YqjD/DUF883 family membrane-anchored ribosome-binding protein
MPGHRTRGVAGKSGVTNQESAVEDSQMSSEVTTERLVEDLKTVMNDAEALLRATSAQTGEKIQEVRARAEESLRQARARLSEVEEEALRRARELADATEEYVRDNPWQSVGIAAGIGLVLGILISRR